MNYTKSVESMYFEYIEQNGGSDEDDIKKDIEELRKLAKNIIQKLDFYKKGNINYENFNYYKRMLLEIIIKYY